MTTRELIELAVLDAMALLDESERRAFDRAFRAAPPAVRAQVRREQARWAADDALLPDVEPPARLREAVLQAVRTAIARREARHAGLTPMIWPHRSTSAVWRTAALALAAAAVVFIAVIAWTQVEINRLDEQFRTMTFMNEPLTRPGSDSLRYIMDPSFRPVHFTPAGTRTTAARAVLYFNAEADSSYLICTDLPLERDRSYQLVVLDDQGRVVRPLATFTPTSLAMGQEVELRIRGEAHLAILAPGRADADLAERMLLTTRVSASPAS